MSEARKLSVLTMTSFGAANLAEGFKSAAFSAFLLFYYQQVLGLSGALTGLALAVSLLSDAITDPVMGYISDGTKTRWGRRHPYILGAAVPLGVFFFLLFNPPGGMGDIPTFLWLTVMAVAARTAVTAYDIPHMALGAEMAPDYNQRTALFSIAGWFRVVSGACVTFIAYKFLFPTTEEYDPGLLNREGYFWLGLIFGIAMIVALVVCFLGTKNQIRYLKTAPERERLSLFGIFRQMLGTWRSVSFRYVFLGLLLYVLIVNVEGSLGTYLSVHFWGLSTETMSILPLASLAGAFVAFPMVNVLTRLFGKKTVLLLVTAIGFININMFVGARLFFPELVPENGSPVITVFAATNAFFVGFIGLSVISTVNSMYADLTDEYEFLTGERREGILFATRSFANKAAGALGLLIGGILLDLIQFPENAPEGAVPDETIWSLGFLYGPVTSSLMLLSLYLYSKYGLNKNEVERIQAELNRVYHSPRN